MSPRRLEARLPAATAGAVNHASIGYCRATQEDPARVAPAVDRDARLAPVSRSRRKRSRRDVVETSHIEGRPFGRRVSGAYANVLRRTDGGVLASGLRCDGSLQLNLKFKQASIPLENCVDSSLGFLASRKNVGTITRPECTSPDLAVIGWSQWFVYPAVTTVVRLPDHKSHNSP